MLRECLIIFTQYTAYCIYVYGFCYLLFLCVGFKLGFGEAISSASTIRIVEVRNDSLTLPCAKEVVILLRIQNQ